MANLKLQIYVILTLRGPLLCKKSQMLITLILKNIGSTVYTFKICIAPFISSAALLTAFLLAICNNNINKFFYFKILFSIIYLIKYKPQPAIQVFRKAKWFKINFALKYKAIYKLVYKGITLYYLLIIVYKNRLRKLVKAKQAKAMQIKIYKLLFKVHTPYIDCKLEIESFNIKKYAVFIKNGVTLLKAKKQC